MLLAHLSDVHLGPLPSVRWHQLLSKRVTGYVNWHRNRASAMGASALDAITADLLAHAPDHVAVSGDLTNLALPQEIARAADWLRGLGPPEAVSVVPGNHDAYVPGALALATRAWSDWMTGERDGAAYPFLRRRGPVSVVGCSTAEASPPFLAIGPFRSDQALRLERLLEGAAGTFRVVLVHHPPIRGATAASHAMRGIERFEGAVRRAGAELVLHGHTHLPTLHGIATPGGEVPVVGVSAAGQAPGGRRPAARHNLFHIEGAPGAWRCRWTERGIRPDGTVGEIASRDLSVPVQPT